MLWSHPRVSFSRLWTIENVDIDQDLRNIIFSFFCYLNVLEKQETTGDIVFVIHYRLYIEL